MDIIPPSQLHEVDSLYPEYNIEDIPEINANGWSLTEAEMTPEHDYGYPLKEYMYAEDGYLNTNNLFYEGGDDGESFFTGPDSDVSFLDIIYPLSEN